MYAGLASGAGASKRGQGGYGTVRCWSQHSRVVEVRAWVRMEDLRRGVGTDKIDRQITKVIPHISSKMKMGPLQRTFKDRITRLWKCLISIKFQESLDSEVRAKQTQSYAQLAPHCLGTVLLPGLVGCHISQIGAGGLEAGLFPDWSVTREGAPSPEQNPVYSHRKPQDFATGKTFCCKSHLPFCDPDSIRKAAAADPESEAQESVGFSPLNSPSTPPWLIPVSRQETPE